MVPPRNDARVQECHPVGDLAREAHLVGGDDHRHAAGGQLTHDIEHLGDELGVESARHLVEQQQVGLHRECPDDRHALLLTARQPVGELDALVGEPEALQQARRVRLRLDSRGPQHLAWGERDVVEHGHVREEVERLEHDADPPPDAIDVHVGSRDVVAFDDDAPGVDRLDQVDAAQQRGLAGARRADEADDLVLIDRQVQATQDLEVAERLLEADDLQRRRHWAAPDMRDLRSRATIQSTRRASGMVTTMNTRATPM